MTMQTTDALRHLQQITTGDQRDEAADSLAVEVITMLMAVDGRAADGDMDDSEPSAAWPMLDTMRRLLDEVELRIMESLKEGRSNQEAADLTDGRYPSKQSFHKRMKVLGDVNRRTLSEDYRRGAAIPKPKPEPGQPEQTPIITCGADWGVCPVHGNTLASSGGQTRCRTTDCGRTWDYDRVSRHCEEPATYTITDATGGTGVLCAAHGLDAAGRMDGSTLAPL